MNKKIWGIALVLLTLAAVGVVFAYRQECGTCGGDGYAAHWRCKGAGCGYDNCRYTGQVKCNVCDGKGYQEVPEYCPPSN